MTLSLAIVLRIYGLTIWCIIISVSYDDPTYTSKSSWFVSQKSNVNFFRIRKYRFFEKVESSPLCRQGLFSRSLVRSITANQRKCKSCRREEVRQRRLWDLAVVSSFQGQTRKLRIDLLSQGLSNAHAEIRCTELYDLWVKRYRRWQRDSSPVRLTSNLFTLNSINCVERVVSRLSDGWCFRSC